jgi:hypothetical protein
MQTLEISIGQILLLSKVKEINSLDFSNSRSIISFKI